MKTLDQSKSHRKPNQYQFLGIRMGNGVSAFQRFCVSAFSYLPSRLVRDRHVQYRALVRSTIPTARGVPAIIRTPHPLGPIVFEAEADRPMVARAVGAAVLGGCLLLFAVASRLEPAVGGIGTHEQLGLAPCGMMVLWGVPCPTCGMTTAFAHAARGQLASAFHAQPAGLTLAIAIGLAAIAAGGTLVTGRTYRVNWFRLSPTGVGFGVVGLLLGGWSYKIVTTLCR